MSCEVSAAQWLASRQALVDIEREICRKSLAEFARLAWPILEPETPYLHNWHIEAVCAHLEAITRGEINRLLINVPPGTAKSLLVSVIWPAWEWGPAGKPAHRFLSTAFNDKPVTRDTRKTRDLILSEWYQERWPEVRLTRVGETSFANDRTGTREGVAFGSLTSQRGDRLLIDDPHSTDTAESDVDRTATTRRFREGAQNRLNDLKKSAIVVIMQRLHEEDISGVILELGLPFVHLCLPMEFEVERKCSTPWYTDPRTKEGELLFPALFPADAIADLKKAQGEYAWAGQYQQRPSPREGGLFKTDRFIIVKSLPKCSAWCRAWDLAGTEGAGKFTAGVLIGKLADGSGYVVADARRRQFSPGKVQKLIKSTAKADRSGRLAGKIDDATGEFISDEGAPVLFNGNDIKRIRLPKDPGQAAVAQKADYVKLLDGFPLKMIPTSGEGDKEARATPFSVQVEGGRVFMLEGEWNAAFTDELKLFPSGKYSDQVDAAADAYNELIGAGGDKTPAFAPVGVGKTSDFSGAAR